MGIHDDVRDSLIRELKNRKNKNPKYSLRAFANSLGISASRLSDVLNEKRKFSTSQLEKINSAIGDPVAFQMTNIKDFERKSVFKEEEFELIANWIYLAVLSFLNAKKTEYSTSQLAQIFESPESEMELVLERLLTLRLVAKNTSEPAFPKWSWILGPERTTDQTPNAAIRQFHKKTLAEASSRLESVPVDQRDYSSSIMTIDPAKLPQAKEEIKKFRRKMAAFLEEGTQEQVYALNIQLVPLSKIETKDV